MQLVEGLFVLACLLSLQPHIGGLALLSLLILLCALLFLILRIADFAHWLLKGRLRRLVDGHFVSKNSRGG
ncbi:hypothetical protein BST31_00750 [Mycobacterium marseillense]|nr:hypothetical protein BST31_00750 [Mycobacterium marseillense]